MEQREKNNVVFLHLSCPDRSTQSVLWVLTVIYPLFYVMYVHMKWGMEIFFCFKSFETQILLNQYLATLSEITSLKIYELSVFDLSSSIAHVMYHGHKVGYDNLFLISNPYSGQVILSQCSASNMLFFDYINKHQGTQCFL